jgi:hypothetical protein
VILFREAIRSDPLSLVVELAAGALILFGIWVLARSERVTGGRGERARDARTQTGSSDATLRT